MAKGHIDAAALLGNVEHSCSLQLVFAPRKEEVVLGYIQLQGL